MGMFKHIESIPKSKPSDGIHLDLPDDCEITEKTCWEYKGCAGPGHSNMDRRVDMMNVMGIHRQLVFPTMALAALSQTQGGLNNGVYLRLSSDEEKELAWDAIEAYNEWAGAITSKHSDRLRVAAVLATGKPGATPEWLLKETQRLIKTGVKVVFVASGRPPVGLSPDDKRLDPWYATMAEANVALVTHPPAGTGFISQEWAEVANAVTWHHIAEEYFVAVMIMGGVFERHPTLRFGVMESGGSWVGPLADLMDFWAGAKPRHRRPESFRPPYTLPRRPSEYLARNVRVVPLNFEPVEEWFQRWPHLEDVFCYSTDYPHLEGQSWSLHGYYENLAPLGDKYLEKFFVTNGQYLLA